MPAQGLQGHIVLQSLRGEEDIGSMLTGLRFDSSTVGNNPMFEGGELQD